ncbi:MAG TPA: class I SAM-dependent methyltransferase [Candidatus Thermoplasmatota archaeon]|nr:class I SAM-dependent methyltransferase [Candidatus Thermoplasmatota archaeon]
MTDLPRAAPVASPSPPMQVSPQAPVPAAGQTPLLVLEDLEDLSDANLRRLQGLLLPGGRLEVRAARRPRHVARRLRPYFEGTPGAGKAYGKVRAVGGVVVGLRRGPGLRLGHFDHLADEYAGEIPSHLVAHYLGRKVQQIRGALGPAHPTLGLDVGCGVGLYADAVAQALGCTVVGVDASPPALRHAPTRDRLAAADAQHLPFPDGTFDFAYAINMVHHLKRGEQELALAEAARVLRPGAPLLVFEINTRNPLFRFYMRHVFPRTRRIDRGDEEFLLPRELAAASPLPVESVQCYTFIPDFAPRWSLPLLRPAERFLERTMGSMSIHYTAILRKPSA